MLGNDRDSIGAHYLRDAEANEPARSKGAALTTAAQEDQVQSAMQPELMPRTYSPTKLHMMGSDPVADEDTTRGFVDPESQQAKITMAALTAKPARARLNP
ncbi:uncharacterized protein L969DRAFT_90129 [Mixia osmundae IAM 14324]|uniref:uncharacterized protein n=1 Tax=Mixia osmundae (strain CBS 9802 / IAM 14324 / JCM 22182 / KY 12970) TaxID=764103 RepID=UPI0004A55A06|nr:uncharacterized protein L969DRAFT_91249 [Mixia osmundae IAM 14324]XP_014565649.1 uncharacterized protein L969DRAFT_90129 [Mixia osmundae IAM 14324]KEI36120.1 hypothetical protein L969DRAFT_91249 [Mixia osmundae IAM 14324]KEI37075.1 hypothetical protein L969DRAFT_90129 [Mixia osmundae IAM 14324]